MRRIDHRVIWLLLCVSLPSCTQPGRPHAGQEQASEVITNPIAPSSADPWVIRHGDTYYYTHTTGGDVRICKAEKLQEISADCVSVWTPPEGTMYSKQLWAPELHYLDGRWYVYVAASDGDNVNHRMYVIESTSEDPQGDYTFKGKIAPETDRWAIDGTVLELDGRRYFVWSGWEGFEDGRQDLYIAPMSNPWTITGERTRIATPVYDWEKHGLPINEGPQVLVNGDDLYIAFSASGYWTPEYSMGLLRYTGRDATDPASWEKLPEPVFTGVGTGEVQGTGHASFTTSCDGRERWIVYHAHRPDDAPRRDLRMQPFTFGADGLPDFGRPVKVGMPISAPSGC